MTIQVGIIGFAHGHVNAYCKMWRDHPQWGVKPVAGWDHDADRLAKAGETHGVETVAELDRLLNHDAIHAVVIAAETSMHADLVEQAAAAGKAIILQKPAALTLPEADRIVAAVNTAGVPFTMAWQMRVDAQNLLMKQMIEAGDLGRVLMVRRRHGLSTHVWGEWFTESWHVDPALNRGMWADDAAHAIDFLYWLLGEPVSVMAEIDTLLNPNVPDDNGIAIFRFPDGLMAEAVCSFTCVAGENTTEIVGEKGVILQNFGDAPSANVPRSKHALGLKWYLHEQGQWNSSELESPANHGDRIADLAQPLAAFLRGEREPIATAEEGRTSLKMVLASYASAETGRRIAFNTFHG